MATPDSSNPIVVRAIALGSYPEPGAVRARMRQPGEVFIIKSMDDFAGPEKGAFGWMELASTPPSVAPEIPPTTVENAVQDPMAMTPGLPPGGISQPAAAGVPPSVPTLEQF